MGDMSRCMEYFLIQRIEAKYQEQTSYILGPKRLLLMDRNIFVACAYLKKYTVSLLLCERFCMERSTYRWNFPERL